MLGVIISHHGNMSLQTMNHLTLIKKSKKKKRTIISEELSTSVILPSILGHSIGLHNIQRGGEEKEEEEEEESIGNESDCDNDVDEEVDIHTQ